MHSLRVSTQMTFYNLSFCPTTLCTPTIISTIIFKYKPVAAVISEKEKIVPDQEKPELVVHQPIFSYATYISASPQNTLHS